MNKKNKSRAGLVVASLYLMIVIASFVIMLATQSDTPMSGIFLVMVTPPWTLALGALQKLFHTDSTLFAGIFLLAGGVINAAVLYKITNLVASRFKKKK